MSLPLPLYSRINCIEDCVGPKARLDVAKERPSLALMEIERHLLGRPAHSRVAKPSELSWLIFKHKYARNLRRKVTA
jgi:hypothetical protein